MFEILLRDRSPEIIDDADAYQQEGQLTTFFQFGDGRHVVDCWSTRVASFRTSEVLEIRRLAESGERGCSVRPNLRSLAG
jgi:hypothetical protein